MVTTASWPVLWNYTEDGTGGDAGLGGWVGRVVEERWMNSGY